MDLRAEVARLRRENQTLHQQLAATQAANHSLRERVRLLEQDNHALRTQNAASSVQLQSLQEQCLTTQTQLTAVQQQLAALDLPAPRPVFKAKSSLRPKTPRRKRAPEHNQARRREPPTQVEQHALDQCPDCGYALRGTSIARRRQVIELPPPAPVDVIEHQVIKRWCPHCERWQAPHLDLRGQVVGQGRFGVRLCALIVYLYTTLRLPLHLIQRYLAALHGLRISRGGIQALLHRVRQAVDPLVAGLQEQIRGSPVVYGDETGWRENGQNGYIWSFSTEGPTAVRYYVYHHSRSGDVVAEVLGTDFAGVLVSDFYGAYNGKAPHQQRCWVHLLRDLHDLKAAHPTDKGVGAWVKAVGQLYKDGKALCERDPAPTEAERRAGYAQLVARAQRLGRRYAQQQEHPCHALAQRLLRHLDELFQFVCDPAVRPDNNLAERSIRPLVVQRKISGGSRSAEGSTTRMGLASLMATWLARGLNPLEECLKWLRQPPMPPVPLPQG